MTYNQENHNYYTTQRTYNDSIPNKLIHGAPLVLYIVPEVIMQELWFSSSPCAMYFNTF
jgi:hypothetical protein